jgi:hypothetical protein
MACFALNSLQADILTVGILRMTINFYYSGRSTDAKLTRSDHMIAPIDCKITGSERLVITESRTLLCLIVGRGSLNSWRHSTRWSGGAKPRGRV